MATRGGLTRSEWLRIASLGGAVAVLHAVGWGLFAWYSAATPGLVGLGTLAYTFGLRHAFDADHIAAIDNTTRAFLGAGRRGLGVGFFFSLGHSSVVFALVLALAVAAGPVGAALPALQAWGGVLGMGVSGTFLLAIGALNLLVLLDLVRSLREVRGGSLDEGRVEARLLDRGFMSRGVLRRVGGRVRASWHMYPLGVLFGLGFDTATEVGLLAVSAGAAQRDVPLPALLSLPLLFAAGMVLLDTVDAIFMGCAYGWALSNPVRKLHYNTVVTAISVAVAVGLGSFELLQIAAPRLSLLGFLDTIGLDAVGYAIVAAFAIAWAAAVVVWKAAQPSPRHAD